jgi:hypothetical protein
MDEDECAEAELITTSITSRQTLVDALGKPTRVVEFDTPWLRQYWYEHRWETVSLLVEESGDEELQFTIFPKESGNTAPEAN